jgi:cytochrome c-type biogenesis protein CcmH/NrfG
MSSRTQGWRRVLRRGAVVGFVGVAAVTAWPAAAEPGPKPSTSQPLVSKKSHALLRDPAGVRGISPFADAIDQGDRAFVAKDNAAAVRAYQAAIQHRPEDATGYLRLATVLRSQANKEATLGALDTALKVAGEPTLRARVLLFRAETFERFGDLQRARADWQSYQALVKEPAKGSKVARLAVYPETADERLRQIAAASQRTEQYQAVRARIETRQQELDAKTRPGADSSTPR